MGYSLFHKTDAAILCLLLFAGCIVMVSFGRLVRNKFFHKDTEELRGGVDSLRAALFGLLGFILAFTFSNSSTRHNDIVSTMVDEYNAIRNVIYRSEFFPDSIRRGYREDLKNYIQLRIDYYNYATDIDKLNQATEHTTRIYINLWLRTQRALTQPNASGPAAIMLPALSSMNDLASKRDALLNEVVPEPIFYLLFFMALFISFTGGFTMPVIAKKDWVFILGFILVACLIIYITLDLSRPMRGLIKPDFGEERIEQLQKLILRYIDSSEKRD